MMNIVVLDGFAMNPGDLSWDGLKNLGECIIYDRTKDEQIVERSCYADIVATNKIPFSRKSIASLPKLKHIAVTATGYNIIDLQAVKEYNISVSNVPVYSQPSVAQSVFAHILNLTLRTNDHARTVRDGKWSGGTDWCYWDHPLIELQGLTLGIIGLGQIGQAVARLALAFGMRVIYNTISGPKKEMEQAKYMDLETVLAQSDILSLHCPLTPQTNHLISQERIALMKKGSLLINTSRGPIIDERALADALNKGHLAGAGLDVLATEPPLADNPLLKAKNCFITPHIAWATQGARQRLLNTVIKNIEAFINGSPENLVD